MGVRTPCPPPPLWICTCFQKHSNSYLEILKSKYIKDSDEFGLVLAWISTLIDSIDKPGKRPRVKALGNGMAIIRRLKYTSYSIMETVIKLQCSLFITLCFGPIEMDHIISDSCYKGTILRGKYRKMIILL